jgi:uncharacterized protein
MKPVEQFAKKQYLNLETFRKSGVGVKTPVWFVQESGTLYVMTMPFSGKAKRIRNNGRVNIAPCRMDGTVIGDWVSAQARQITDAAVSQEVDRLFDRKYGLLKKITKFRPARQEVQNIFLEIKPLEQLP